MTHFGIICPTGSHLTAHFPLGNELQQRGHRVTFLNIVDVQERVLAANFEFKAIAKAERPIGSDAELLTQRGNLKGMAALRHTLNTVEQDMRVILQDAPAIIESEGIEALLVDQCSPVGGTVADFLHIPFISLCAALPLNRDTSLPPVFTTWQYSSTWQAKLRNHIGYTVTSGLTAPIRKLTAEYRQQWNLPRHRNFNDACSRLAQLSQLPIEFDFPRANLPSNFHFTGPYSGSLGREPIAFPWERLTGQSLIYASMGTVQNRLLPVFEAIATACVGLDIQLVISLGGGMSLEVLPTLPGTPLVVSYAPQLELLQKAALTITHAGLNTVLESLSNGVPAIAIPVANDQPGIAARLVWAGVGEMIPIARLTVPTLRTAIRRMLTQDSYKVQALRLQAIIQKSGGVNQAVNIIESALTTGEPVLRCAG